MTFAPGNTDAGRTGESCTLHLTRECIKPSIILRSGRVLVQRNHRMGAMNTGSHSLRGFGEQKGHTAGLFLTSQHRYARCAIESCYLPIFCAMSSWVTLTLGHNSKAKSANLFEPAYVQVALHLVQSTEIC